MKNPLKSKTIIFNVLVAILAALQITEVMSVLPISEELLVAIVAVGNIVLRFVTIEPVGL